MLQFLEDFTSRGCRVLLVFDGRASDAKQAETMRRRLIREEEMKSAQVIQEILKSGTMELSDEQKLHLQRVAEQHARRGWQCTREIRHDFKNTL